jgi:hypothetical protein
MLTAVKWGRIIDRPTMIAMLIIIAVLALSSHADIAVALAVGGVYAEQWHRRIIILADRAAAATILLTPTT